MSLMEIHFAAEKKIVSYTSAWQKMQFIYGRENSHE
jgi:hypothetical protein